MKIMQFKGEYRWLSNFWQSPIDMGSLIYPTVEHFYQAMKATTIEDREMIRNASTPGKAKRLGRKIRVKHNWDEVKIMWMWKGLNAKFTQHQDLANKLKNTGSMHLQEGNTWNDTFWGVNISTGKGNNVLGQLLMMIRDTF